MPPKNPQVAGEWLWLFFARPDVVSTVVMQTCYVKDFSGRTMVHTYRSTDVVLALKERIAARVDIPLPRLALIFRGGEMQDEREVQHYLSKEACIHILDRGQMAAGQAAAGAAGANVAAAAAN